MKKGMRKTIAAVLALTVTISMSGAALAETIFSNGIRLPNAKPRPEAPVAETTEETSDSAERVFDHDVEAHAAPNANSAVKFTVKAGTPVQVLDEQDGWIKTTNGKFEAWILVSGGNTAEATGNRAVTADVDAHAAPNPKSAVKFTVKAGTEVEVLQEKMGWWQVANGKQKGWIYMGGETELMTAEGELRQGVVIDGGEDGVDLYKTPDGEVIGQLAIGTDLAISEIGDDWSKVETKIGNGYLPTADLALFNAEAKEDEKIRTIQIVNDLNGATEIPEGTVVTFTAILNGFENDTYTMQWFEAPEGGEFAPMAGETGLSVSVPVTQENIGNTWRFEITLTNAK